MPKRVTDPPVRAEPSWDTPRTRQLAVTACFNCHSDQTHGLWFERIAPVSWWINGHVEDGCRALNFSEYDPNHHRRGGTAQLVGDRPAAFRITVPLADAVSV